MMMSVCHVDKLMTHCFYHFAGRSYLVGTGSF